MIGLNYNECPKYKIDLRNINNLNDYIRDVNNSIMYDIDAYGDKYIVDGKNIFMMISICHKPITVVLRSKRQIDIMAFNEICKKYEVE